MKPYAGIDVSLGRSSICVVDATGRIMREDKVASDPRARVAWFSELKISLTRIGLEARPLSQWLCKGLKEVGLAVELQEIRHVRTTFKTMPVKTYRKDARGMAQLLRMG
jgi:transposase